MLYCYECSASFARLRDLAKHERVHRRRGHCSACDVYFTTKERELAHHREVHTRSIGTQTEQQESSPRRPRKRNSRCHRRKWRPSRGQSPQPSCSPQVASVVVAPESHYTKGDLEEIDLNEEIG